MIKLVFLLEEPSAKAFLDSFLPRFLCDEIFFQCVPHEGKRDLENSIPRKIRGWQEPNTYFVVLRDQDAGDYVIIKKQLKGLCIQAGRKDTLIRIACRELESWYLGDLKAVETALGKRNLSNLQKKSKYRNPDNLMQPSKEIQKLVPEYQKISSSRLIGKTIECNQCMSTSFKNFTKGLNTFIQKAKIGRRGNYEEQAE